MKQKFIVSNDTFIIDNTGLLSFNEILQYLDNINNYCHGYYENGIVVVNNNYNKIMNYIVYQQLHPKKIFILPEFNGLCKKYCIGNFDEFIGYDGSEMNFSNWEQYGNMRFVAPDLQDKLENNEITKTYYGPRIQRTWYWDEPCDHAEWMLQDSR